MSNTQTRRRQQDFQAGDRKFFQRHPDRQFRLRRMSQDEMAVVLDDDAPKPAEGNVWVVVVQNVAPGMRTYQSFQMMKKASVFCHMWDDFHCGFAVHQGWLMCPYVVAQAMTNRGMC
ncbi:MULTISPECIES: hypothetical protein [unclassified Ruegeria]|uniref:hypothetical protein n=1 Tax=unclassified Ruegeria TaxID=2625375 RepID=UPI00148938BF|nr:MULTISPECIES: hypothetical protein [unclassified Ruegeria]NOD62183.1 hypothetical protein [Ruegeria sp. HKCCD6109]NOD96992.1 hypothetical protein [Ruegeria sp. HKCCD6228]